MAARKCYNCKSNSTCKLQEYFTDKESGILTCPDFKK